MSATMVTKGRIWTLDTLQNRKPLILIFSQPSCGACEALLPEVARWQDQLEGASPSP